MLPTRRALPQRVGVIIAIVLLAGALAFLALGNIGFAFLLPDEQLVMRGLSTVDVQNGPGLAVYAPFVTRTTKRKGVPLDERQYMVVTNELTAVEKTVSGPQLYFPAPHETWSEERPKVVVEKNEYVQLLDVRNGEQRQERGPATVVPEPFETLVAGGPQRATKLSETEFVVVTDRLTGARRVELGPALFFPRCYDALAKPSQKLSLKKHEYAKLLDDLTGEIRVVAGPTVLVPEPTETVVGGAKRAAFELQQHQYVKLIDQGTGVVRVERGEKVVFPRAHEEPVDGGAHSYNVGFTSGNAAAAARRDAAARRAGDDDDQEEEEWDEEDEDGYEDDEEEEDWEEHENGRRPATAPARGEARDADDGARTPVRDAVNVDEETAVLVLSTKTGQQRLVVERGLFFPEWHEEILEVRKLIRVEPHEVAIVRDNDGAFHFHAGGAGADGGDGTGTAFFLPPHHELVTMYWGSGTSAHDVQNHVVSNARQVKYKVPVQKIDLRSQYAFFEYTVRTSDNVELSLEGTISWQVVDVPRMIERTSDPKGDVWYHARSSLIQAVSKVTLEEFMGSFNTIVSQAAVTDSSFYEQRGVRLHGLEIVRYECVDDKTANVLHEIIQETTNRINSLQKQRSENEVERERLTAQIELENQRKQLIEARTANEMLEASSAGEADGTRLGQNSLAFLELLTKEVPNEDTRMELLRFFSEQQTKTAQTKDLAQGKATLFLTPQDLNLKLQMPPPGASAL